MKIVYSLVIVCSALWETMGFPSSYGYYGTNVDSLSYGSADSSRGGMVLSRYFNPYYTPQTVGGGMAAFMFRQPEQEQPQQTQTSQYYLPDRRRQTSLESNFAPPQQNEVYPTYPQLPEKPIVTEPNDIPEPTERIELSPTTVKAIIVPELTEPEIEEVEEEPVPVQKPKKRVSKKKQVKRPVEDDEEEDDYPRLPASAFFPMFFGYGGRAAGGGPGGPTAVANAYSTGRGGVASSHATAYGAPRPEAGHKYVN